MSFEPVLHLISDHHRHRLPLLDALVEGAAGGADVLQIRDKRAPASETYELIKTLQTACRNRGLAPQLFVNDRVDVALATPCDGVHLASKSLPIHAVRSIGQKSAWTGIIGCSVHSYDEAMAAAAAGADYITFGHVYASESHRDLAPRGLLELKRIVQAVKIPVLAIGGIDVTNVLPVLETGCSGVAVIGSVLNAGDPKQAAAAIKEQMLKSSVLPRYAFPS